MKKFEFQEKGHRYFLDDKPLTGVTTVLGVIAKPALINWSAKMAVESLGWIKPIYENPRKKEGWKNKEKCLAVAEEFLGANMDGISAEDYFNLLTKAKNAHCQKRDDAGKKGTDVHAEIEEIIKDAIKNFNGIILKEKIIGLNENKQVQNFTDWAIKNKIKFFESEKKMYSEKNWVAGTVDFTCEIAGKKYVGDIKTSSGIYGREPMAQCAAYRMMLEEMGEKDFAGSVIVNIKKTGKFNEEKDVYWSEDYEEDLNLFLGALQIYRIIKNTKFTK